MQALELHSLEQRFGKFEGVQQQHDRRLTNIEERLNTIEILISDLRTEGHHERETLRAELAAQIETVRTEGRSEREALRTELNERIDKLSDKIDGLYKWIIGILIAVGASVIAAIVKGFF